MKKLVLTTLFTLDELTKCRFEFICMFRLDLESKWGFETYSFDV